MKKVIETLKNKWIICWSCFSIALLSYIIIPFFNLEASWLNVFMQIVGIGLTLIAMLFIMIQNNEAIAHSTQEQITIYKGESSKHIQAVSNSTNLQIEKFQKNTDAQILTMQELNGKQINALQIESEKQVNAID